MAVLVAACAAAPASGQLRVVEWNVSNYESGRVAAFETAIYAVNPANGLSMAPDVLIGQEFLSATGVTNFLAILNGAPESPGDWAAAPFLDGPDTDNAFFYRATRVDLLATTIIAKGGPAPNHPRDVVRYDIKLVGYDAPSTIIACYSTHMKSGGGSDDEERRLLECDRIREDAESLPADWSFLVAGDTNIRRSFEEGYQSLLEAFVDPIATPGNWHNNAAFRFVHTQDPVGQGGMDDRFDLILVSASLVDRDGLEYIGNSSIGYSTSTWDDPRHSYRSWGNDGTTFDAPIRVNGNTMVGAAIAQALQDTAQGQGHLPVFLDLRVPAAISSETALDFGEVRQRDIAERTLTVTNTGDVDRWTAGGIDDLVYTFSTSTKLVRVPDDEYADPAGDGGAAHVIALDTREPGPIDATITIESNAPDEPQRVVRVTALIVEACLGDVDDDGLVGFTDVVSILAAWGNFGGPEDLDGSGVVSFSDLLIALAEWGPCPGA